MKKIEFSEDDQNTIVDMYKTEILLYKLVMYMGALVCQLLKY